MIAAISIILLLSFISWMYIFNIYEIDIKIDRQTLFSNGKSRSVIELVPMNSIGMKAPFRNVNSKINFVNGKELVDVILDEKNLIILQSKFDTGKVELKIESEYLLYPNKYNFEIKLSEAS